MNAFESAAVPAFEARLLSLFKALYAESPTRTVFFLLKLTHEGIVSLRVSVFLIVGSPPSILEIAELVVPKSIP